MTRLVEARPVGRLAERLFGGFFAEVRRNKYLFLLLLPAIVYFVTFHYLPMMGVIIAFQKYRVSLGFFRSPLGRSGAVQAILVVHLCLPARQKHVSAQLLQSAVRLPDPDHLRHRSQRGAQQAAQALHPDRQLSAVLHLQRHRHRDRQHDGESADGGHQSDPGGGVQASPRFSFWSSPSTSAGST